MPLVVMLNSQRHDIVPVSPTRETTTAEQMLNIFGFDISCQTDMLNVCKVGEDARAGHKSAFMKEVMQEG
jgi:hypothetical protein